MSVTDQEFCNETYKQDSADTIGLHPKLKDIHGSAYESAGESAEAGDHGLSDEIVKAIARTSARQEVFEALMEFKAVTSYTRKTYPFKWGEYWDEMNDHREPDRHLNGPYLADR